MMEVNLTNDGLKWVKFKDLAHGDCFATSRDMVDVFIKVKNNFTFETTGAGGKPSHYNCFRLPGTVPSFTYDDTLVIKLKAILNLELERE